MCDCISEADALLKERGYNAAIAVAMPYWIENGAVVLSSRMEIATIKADPSSRKKPVTMMATYCPLCGEKYRTKPESTELEVL